MIISVIQFNPVFGAKKDNLKRMENLFNQANGEIIVFPELSTTGYDFQNREEIASLSEDFKGETYDFFNKLSQNTNKIICYGFAEKFNDKLFNSAACIFPEENSNTVYRKSHLFYREKLYFDESTDGFIVVNFPPKDISIGLMICYDWRFPESARTLALKGADLIVCPSNLVTDVWHISMPSRALENKVYLAVANRIGNENRNNEDLKFKGESAIYSFNGQIISKATPNEEEIIEAEIHPNLTRNKKFNDLNDIFFDRRPELYI